MDTIVMYQTQHGWRWTRRNGDNGQITGASSEEYVRQEDCRHNVETTQKEPYLLVVDGEPNPNAMQETPDTVEEKRKDKKEKRK